MEEKKSIKITIENEDLVAPLYLQYSGQCCPQPAYIEINPRGDEIEISAEINRNIGSGYSLDAFNGVVYLISCPEYVLGSALKDYLYSDTFTSKCRAMCEGYKCEWDGANYRGHWSSNSWQLVDDIHMDLLTLRSVEIYDGYDFIAESVTYYNDEGEKTNNRNEAFRAVYDEAGLNIEITSENLDQLVEDAKQWIESDQIVEGIDDAFLGIIEEIENNIENFF